MFLLALCSASLFKEAVTTQPLALWDNASTCMAFFSQIRNILKQGIETPEDQNDLRKMQLRELARLNGTLREDDNRFVFESPHVAGWENDFVLGAILDLPSVSSLCRILRPWQNTETRSITNTTVCTKCGGAGHIASDCKFAR